MQNNLNFTPAFRGGIDIIRTTTGTGRNIKNLTLDIAKSSRLNVLVSLIAPESGAPKLLNETVSSKFLDTVNELFRSKGIKEEVKIDTANTWLSKTGSDIVYGNRENAENGTILKIHLDA